MSESAYEEDSFKHGIQSTLLSSARKKSKTIKATKAVICRRKSNKTASAARVQKLELKNDDNGHHDSHSKRTKNYFISLSI